MKLRKTMGSAVTHILLIAISLLFLIPIWWLFISSIKPIDEILTIPPIWWPSVPQWQNYIEALTSPAFPFLQLLYNTLIYCVLATIGTVASSSIVAYAFARMRFVGRDFLFGVTLATLLLPGVVTLIPTYVLFQRMGMVGTYMPLILPYFFGSAFNIFLLRQFMLTIPQELSDAAYVDGAGDFRILWRIMVPLVKPAIVVIAIFNFIYAWNDFLGPLLYLDDASKYPFAIGLYAFRTRFALQWNLLTAAALSITIPLVIGFFVLQRYFIEGVTMTGVKG
jgi:multiple sugar transport system permease protein